MARKKSEDAPPAGCPAWLATYGDMVTLILTFFVLLFSFSTIDAQKWQELVLAFTGNVSVMEGGVEVLPNDGDFSFPEAGQSEDDTDADDEQSAAAKPSSAPSEDPNNPNKASMDAMEQALNEFKDNSGFGNMQVERKEYEIIVRLQGDILFDSGKAILKPDAKLLLDGLFDLVKQQIDVLQFVRIEGHADTVPIDTPQYRDNWMLSSDRAYHVFLYLRDTMPEIPQNKYSQASYGEYQPIDTNDTPEGRANNRRVDLVLVYPFNPDDE